MTVVRAIFRYDHAGLRPVGALIRLLGLAIAAYGGLRFGGLGAAVLAAIGALYAGIASYGGPHEARLRRMLTATVAASVATFVGCLVEPSTGATVLVVALGTFLLALFAATSADAAQVALLATGLLVVFSGLHGARAQPFGNALLVLIGGLAQTAVIMAFNPLSPVFAERKALAATYAAFARFARARAQGDDDEVLPDGGPSAVARELLREGIRINPRPERERLWRELELADALRGGLVGLDRAGDADASVWNALAEWLTDAEGAVDRGRPIERAFPDIKSGARATPWLRRLCRMATAGESGNLPTGPPMPRAWLQALRNVETIRALALGHALRYTVAVSVATAAYRLLDADHGYWAPLALVFSLRPDFAGTVTRGFGRIVGTIGGVLLATGFVSWFHPGANGLAVAVLVATWAAFALLNASFVLYSASLAFWVVTAVTLGGASTATIGPERIVATVAGSGLALVTALVWPRWEARNARTALAVAFAAQAEYADAVGEFESAETAAGARLQARAARLEAERVVAAAEFEPRWSRGNHLEGASAALARLAENAARILAAHVAALDPVQGDSSDDLRRLAAEGRGAAADLMG